MGKVQDLQAKLKKEQVEHMSHADRQHADALLSSRHSSQAPLTSRMS